MANYGLKISANGDNVLDAAAKDLVFTSEANTLKLKEQGEATLSLTNGSSSASVDVVTHSLGYRPWAQTFTLIDSKRYNSTNFCRTQPGIASVLSGTIPGFIWTDITTTKITVYLDIGTDTANGTQDFNVYWYYAIDTAQS